MKTHTAALRSRHANFISRSEGSRCISPCKTPTPSPWTSRRVAWSARDLERGSASEAQPAACAAWGLRACNIYTYLVCCVRFSWHVPCRVRDVSGRKRHDCGLGSGKVDVYICHQITFSAREMLTLSHCTAPDTDICNLGLSQNRKRNRNRKHKARHKQIANTTDRGLCANARVS